MSARIKYVQCLYIRLFQQDGLSAYFYGVPLTPKAKFNRLNWKKSLAKLAKCRIIGMVEVKNQLTTGFEKPE